MRVISAVIGAFLFYFLILYIISLNGFTNGIDSGLLGNKHVQICYTFWTDFWICSPWWDTVPWFCDYHRSCHHRSPSNNTLVVDGTSSAWDSWGTLWLPFPMEPLKLHSFVWRVSLRGCHFLAQLDLCVGAVYIRHLLVADIFCFIVLQCWFPRLPSPFALYKVRQLLLDLYLHGLVSNTFTICNCRNNLVHSFPNTATCGLFV